jgi:DNA-binding transcriptional ArsR family regulator
MSASEKVTELQASLKKTQDELATEKQRASDLADKLKVLQPENEENALKILEAIANTSHGMSLNDLAEKTGLHRERVRFVLKVAEKAGHVLAHGGGDDPLYYKLQDGGRVYLMSKNVI